MREYEPESGWVGVRANGLRHGVLEDGEGPLVLMQHGFPDTAHTWDEVVPGLVEAGYRVVRPFGRGIAPSERPAGDDFGVRALAEDLLGLIDALGEERATVVGHDFGAAAAWGLGHMAPERIDRLVLVAIPHPAAIRASLAKLWGVRHFLTNRMPWAEWRFRRGDYAEIRRMYERWSPEFDWPEEEFEAAKNAYAAPGCLDAALGYYRCLSGWPFRGRVSVDTLVIGGRSDGVASAEDFERSARRVEGECRVQMLPGGHFLHREHPEPFRTALLDYLGPA